MGPSATPAASIRFFAALIFETFVMEGAMIQLDQLVKNRILLPDLFTLLFLMLDVSEISRTYAAAKAIPSVLSSNWSGLEAKGPLGTFRKSQCIMKVPRVVTVGDVSIWCGLGGDPKAINQTNPAQGVKQAILVQAGIDACIDSSCIGTCQPGVQCNYAWWEIANALIIQPIQFSQGIHVGDSIYVYIQSNFHEDKVDLFRIQNWTTGEVHTIRVTSQGATKDNQPIGIIGQQPPNGFSIVSDGASVECIVERPLDIGSNSYIRLATFQSTTITSCDGGLMNQALLKPIASLSTVTKVNMFSDANQRANATSGIILARPTDPYGQLLDSFNVVQESNVQNERVANSIGNFLNPASG